MAMSLFRRLAFLAAILPALVLGAEVPLGAALDGAGLAWTTGGSAIWTGQTAVSQDGADAARAFGLEAPDTETWLETTVTAPGYLSWHWRLDLGPDQASTLELLVGEEFSPLQSLAQATAWTAASETIDAAGPVKIRWRLFRTAEAPAAVTDAAFLDQVAFTPFGPPVLQAPAELTARGFTARWSALPLATDYAIEIGTTVDFSDARLLPSVPAPSTTCAVTGLDPLTTYHYRLVAYGPESLTAVSNSLSLATPAPQRPANDAFASAAILSGPSGSAAATNREATLEPDDEPAAHRASVWFTWTAPTAGRWRFSTSAADFEPVLYLYKGSALSVLELLAESENNAEDGSTFLEFDADAGVAYRLVLDSGTEAQGPVTLSWQRLALHSPPANDTFASAAVLSGNSGSLEVSNLHATAEPGEPAPAVRSVWWRWTAPASGFWNVDTAGSAIPVALQLWSGNSVGALTLLGADAAEAPAASRAGIPVTAGVTYRVSLDGQLGAQGALRLGWAFTVPTVAQSIAFAPLPDLGIDAEPFVLAASASSGLPVTFTLLSGPAILDEDGVTLTPTGQTGTVAVRADQPGDATRLPAPFVIRTFAVRPPPANDDSTAAAVFSGPSGSLSGSNLFATVAPGDPFPSSRSVWWRWTAPSNGMLSLNTEGSAVPAALSVLSGPAPDELDLVAADTRPGAFGRVEFPVVAGAIYYVVLDALDNLQGTLRLAWFLAPPSLDQTIDFAPLADLGVDAAPAELLAKASSGLDVIFTLVSGPATLDGPFLTFTGRPGTVTVRAAQPGDAVYRAAPPVTRSFVIRPPPDNDEPAAALRLSGASGSVTGTNLHATAGSADPYPAGHSVWWRWSAPSNGILSLDTDGSAVPAALSVLAGPTPDELEFVAADARPGIPGRLELPVSAGAVYYFVLDAFDDLQGTLRLAWSLAPPSVAQTITFDQPLPDLIVGDPGFFLSATSDSGLPVAFSLVSGPATLEEGFLGFTGRPGTVTIRASQPGDATRLPAEPVTRSFTVAKLPAIRITLSELRQDYTGSPLSVTAAAEPAPRVSDLVVTYNGDLQPPVNAGTYAVVATADDSRATAKMVIAKASLVVTALDRRKLAGQDNPEFALAYSGFVGTDGESSLVRVPIAATSAKKTSPGGLYPIKVSGGASPNYDFTYVPGILEVDTFAGRYEALLSDAGTGLPAAKLEFTVAASGAPFTGRLTLPDEPAPLAFKGVLSLDVEDDRASATLELAAGSGLYRLVLDIPLLGDFTAALSRGDALLGTSEAGLRIFAPAARETLSWSGAHTVLLAAASPLVPDSPAPHPKGTGHALATIDAKGNLKLAGKLADGQPLTATLAPGPAGDYRLFAQPYGKRAQSYLAGALSLAARADLPARRHLPFSAGARLIWAKTPSSAKTPDKTYRAGFGPLAVAVSVEPWLPPTAAAPLAGRLGLGAAPASFAVDCLPPPNASFTPAQLDSLPATLGLAPDGKPILPSPNPARFSLTLMPATGAFAGAFTLFDQLSPSPAKPIVRKVAFSGVLRQPSEPGADLVIGQGFFLLPALPGSSDEPLSGEIRFSVP